MQKQIDADGGKITMKSLRLGVEGGLVDQSKLVEGANEMADKMGSMSGSIVTQRAVSYVQDEYKAQGIDPVDVQNAYLGRMATTMFGLCLISLVATILTGAVASRTACSIARDLRRETFNKVMHFSPAEVGKFSQASLITRCTNDIQQIQMAATLFIRMCLMAPVMGIVAVMRVLANHTGLEWTIAVAIICLLYTSPSPRDSLASWPTTPAWSGPSPWPSSRFRPLSACSWASPCPSSKRCRALWTA